MTATYATMMPVSEWTTTSGDVPPPPPPGAWIPCLDYPTALREDVLWTSRWNPFPPAPQPVLLQSPTVTSSALYAVTEQGGERHAGTTLVHGLPPFSVVTSGGLECGGRMLEACMPGGGEAGAGAMVLGAPLEMPVRRHDLSHIAIVVVERVLIFFCFSGKQTAENIGNSIWGFEIVDD